MLALLPVLVLSTCVLACRARLACWREAILAGAVVWGVVLVGITEVLSAFHDFTNRPGLRADYLRAVGLLAQRGCARFGFI